ncbi:MAG: hypothetical protein ACRETL_11495 [Gammaproteobacteria bacterium]
MKKPLSLVALAFWVITVVFIVADVPIALIIRAYARSAAQSMDLPNPAGFADVISWTRIWTETRSAFLDAGQLIGIGFLIELVDQVRWNGLPKDQQIARPPITATIKHLRSWPSRS